MYEFSVLTIATPIAIGVLKPVKLSDSPPERNGQVCDLTSHNKALMHYPG